MKRKINEKYKRINKRISKRTSKRISKSICKRIFVFALVLMFVFLTIPTPNVVRAATYIQLTNEIADMSISELYLDQNHTIILGDNAVTKDIEVFASISIDFKAGNDPVSSEQVFYYDLPPELSFQTVQSGKFYDGSKVAGEYTIDNNRISFHYYDDWLLLNPSNVQTSFDFSFLVTEETIGEGGEKTITFPGIGDIVINTVASTANISKTNSLANYSEDGTIDYTITINVDHDVRSASLSDVFDIVTAGVPKNAVRYIEDSFRLDGNDISSDVSITEPTENAASSFRYPADGGFFLSEGVHVLRYKVKYDETDLFDKDTIVQRVVDNYVSLTTDGIALDDVRSTLRLQNTNLAKQHSEVKYDSATNKAYVDWTITVNDGNAPVDLGGYVLTDTLNGAHVFENLNNSLRVVAEDGTDITAGMEVLSSTTDQFRIRFPSYAGRKKYTVTYRTYLQDNHDTTGYSNYALFTNDSGGVVGISDGESGVGVGKKELDTSNISREMLENGTSENGQADWKIIIPGNYYATPSSFTIGDFLNTTPDTIWFKRSGVNQYDANVTPDSPVITYTSANGNTRTLLKGRDFDLVYGINGRTNGEEFSMWFYDNLRTRQAFSSGFTISYSTQSVGASQTDTYKNTASFNYQGGYVGESFDKYDVSEENNLYKIVSETTRQPDGTTKIEWLSVINGNTVEGIPDSPNVDLNGEEVTIIDTLPAGTRLSMNGATAEKLMIKIDDDDGTVVAWRNIPLLNEEHTLDLFAELTDNTDGTQTIVIHWRSSSMYPTSEIYRYMISLSYLTETEAFELGDYGVKNITNNISASTPSRDLGEAQATTQVTNSAVQKTMEYIVGSGNQLKYVIEVNDGAQELNGGEPLTLWDQFDSDITLVDGSMKVYLGDSDEELTGWTIYGETVIGDDGKTSEKYTLSNLPDKTHLRVEYITVVAGNIGDVVNVENTAALEGIVTEHSSTTSSDVRIEKSAGSASGGSYKIEIVKVDSENINHKLENAVFQLYSVDLTTGIEKLESTEVSNANGIIIFDEVESGRALSLDTLYYFKEIEAPTGYKIDETKRYFILKGARYDEVLASSIDFLGGIVPNSSTSYYAYNRPEKETVEVVKSWFTYDGTAITDPSQLELLPEISVEISRFYIDSEGDYHSEVIRAVELNNDNGWMMSFEVSGEDVFAPTGERYTYSAEEITILSDFDKFVEVQRNGDLISVNVSNTDNNYPFVLPEAGGKGTIPLMATGFAFLMFRMWLCFALRRKC